MSLSDEIHKLDEGTLSGWDTSSSNLIPKPTPSPANAGAGLERLASRGDPPDVLKPVPAVVRTRRQEIFPPMLLASLETGLSVRSSRRASNSQDQAREEVPHPTLIPHRCLAVDLDRQKRCVA